MLVGDGTAPTAAPGLTGKGGCRCFGGRLLSGLCDVGIALPGAVLATLPRKKLSSSSLWGSKDSPSRSDMAEASSGAAGERSWLACPCAIPPVLVLCRLPGQRAWRLRGGWLTQGCQELGFPVAQLTEELEEG